MTSVLTLVLSAQTAFAQDAPVITPTRLDFDASQAPKNCNDDAAFRALLWEWVNPNLLLADRDQRMIVRIHPAPLGVMFADVTLADVAGTTLDQHHKKFPRNTECYKVLYESARTAAKILGALNKPLPPEPIVCPACLACSSCPVCPTCPARSNPTPRMTVPASPLHRASVGAGVFLGMTTRNEVSLGPAISLGFVPFSRWPGFRVEFDGAWASLKTPRDSRVDTVPLFASVCHAYHGLRLCGGLTTTFLSTEHRKDARDFMLSANLRIGTEFVIAGPFSIRADGFALLPLTQRTVFDSPNYFSAGAVAMGVWFFEWFVTT